MIKTTAILTDELKKYRNPIAKIRRLVRDGELIPIIKGLYETDRSIPGYYLAQVLCGPSYLSFEFALAYHSLIPEAVYSFTSATFEKKKAKRYNTAFGMFTYRDVPCEAYPVGVQWHVENGYGFQIASPEKALCDELYIISPLKNRRELKQLLFEELRIDPAVFSGLNKDNLLQIASCYHTQNHRLLQAYVRRIMRDGTDH